MFILDLENLLAYSAIFRKKDHYGLFLPNLIEVIETLKTVTEALSNYSWKLFSPHLPQAKTSVTGKSEMSQALPGIAS